MKRAWWFPFAVSCGEPPTLTEPWQLDHDRVVAVRASPPAIRPGERARIDGLVAMRGRRPRELAPDRVELSLPLPGVTIDVDDAGWFIALSQDLPVSVPLDLDVRFGSFVARKQVAVGGDAPVPMIRGARAGDLDITGSEAFEAEATRELALHVAATEHEDVTWLTSCGELVDYDLADAYLTLDKRGACDLALVIRATGGGVDWQVWTVTPR